ncbi:MAG: phosphoribosylformylglycinamidine synthase subunit PurL [Atribacterota bacterium]|nr:phosphoribosylformylglycinamidine synthase subunit PurL [Atribacterota bacterium]MDD3640267.1 phosphoribosylformylglycinamidine synthase subunit PurL [Atribacterota bacterium]MDD4288974.1 phosphoribosylformylglycinamidine synthase subunit PurL [Atribacterota bacterium]
MEDINKKEETLKRILEENDLTEDEYQKILEALQREPNNTELGLYSAMWSEHCSYKSSKPVLSIFPTQADWVIFGPGENAGVIDIGDGLAVVMKIESHNHPSAVEPFHGAATGSGGVVRDILAMGARPVALLGSLRFGRFEDSHVKYLAKEVAKGLAFYGNNIEVPTMGGETYFLDSYHGNPLVNAMCVGLVKKDDIVVAVAGEKDSVVILAGEKTGRDGVGSASFASRELEGEEKIEHPPIPQGNPYLEKQIIEACLELVEKNLILGMQDLGAAGLISSSCEMASKGNCGIELDLSLVPLKEKGMTPREIMLSETQERMLLVAKPDKKEEIGEIFNKYGIEYTEIGKVTSDGILRLKKKDEIVAEVPAKSLAENVPLRYYTGKEPADIKEIQKLNLEDIAQPADFNDTLLKILSSPNICDKKWMFKDSKQISPKGTESVLFPGDDAGILKIKKSKKAVALTTDGNGRYCYLNPFSGGKIAVAEAARNLSCKGATPMAITDNLNFGNPAKEEIFWQLEESVKGISEACEAFDIPVISGNVSLNNESNGKAIYPTPVIGMAGIIEDFKNVCTMSFKNDGDLVILLGKNREELGGSEYLKVIHNIEKGLPPQLDLNLEKAVQDVCRESIQAGIISSAHDCSDGGLAVTLAECCITGNKGIKADIDTDEIRSDALLFGESQSRIVVSLSEENIENLKAIVDKYEVPMQVLGKVEGERLKIGSLIDIEIKKLKMSWEKEIENE